MKNNKWANLTGTVLAGTTLATVTVISKHMIKKYGQKVNPDNRLINVRLDNVINDGIKRFMNADEDKLAKIINTFSK